VMKVMVCHFVSDSHEVMTALIVVLPLIVVVEISLQLHRSFAGTFSRIPLIFCSNFGGEIASFSCLDLLRLLCPCVILATHPQKAKKVTGG
jgi:hypothetical protein